MTSYMQEALALAEQGRGQTSPNPAVGAVLARDGKVVGSGFHTWAQADHAEIAALRQAGDMARGSTLYVTLEPCAHQGRTGPCVDALIGSGIARVIAAMQDPNPQVGGKGFERLRQAGIEVEVDEASSDAAEQLNEPFVHFMRTGRPLVTVKAALTLDGKIAAPQDNFGWITSEIARRDVQKVRHFSDAILTGLGTVLEDDCLLTDRSGLPRSRPLLRIVLDSQLRIPLTVENYHQRGKRRHGGWHLRGKRGTPQSSRSGRHPGSDCRWRGWAHRSAQVARLPGGRTLFVFDGRSRQSRELDNARRANRG